MKIRRTTENDLRKITDNLRRKVHKAGISCVIDFSDFMGVAKITINNETTNLLIGESYKDTMDKAQKISETIYSTATK